MEEKEKEGMQRIENDGQKNQIPTTAKIHEEDWKWWSDDRRKQCVEAKQKQSDAAAVQSLEDDDQLRWQRAPREINNRKKQKSEKTH